MTLPGALAWLVLAAGQPPAEAQRLLDEGRLKEAIPLLEAERNRHPGDPATTWMLAVARLRLGDYAEAVKLGEIFSRMAPDNANGPRLVGSAWAAAGNLGEAEAAFRRALAVDPDNPFSQLELALLDLRQGNTGRARSQLELLAERWPGVAEILAPLGALHAREGRAPDALAALTRAVRADPGSAEAHHHLGALYSDLARFDLADRHLARALELSPGNPASVSERCLLRSREDRLEEAAEICRTAAEAAPEDAETWFRLGDVLHFLQDAQAEAAYRRTLELDPGHRRARFRLGLWLEEAARSEEAIAVLIPGVDADSPPVAPRELAVGLQTLALAHRSAAEADLARTRLEQAIGVAPMLPEPHLHLGNLLARSDDPELAALGRERLTRFQQVRAFDERVRELQSMVNQDPGAPGPKRELIGHLLGGGAPERALDEARLLLTLSADEPVHHELVVVALAALGRQEEARAMLGAALERWPRHRGLVELQARLAP